MPELKYGFPVPLEEVKSSGDNWEVKGYASTFGNVDLGGDVVMKSAFDGWLAGWKTGDRAFKTRFLYSHQPSMILGRPTEMRADAKGLFVKASISKTQLGQDVRTLVNDGALDSFSIGYIPTGVEFDDSGVRLLKEISLPEFSLVAMPMNPEAAVTGSKAFCAGCMAAIDELDAALKATWDSAYVNDLPDSAFALVYTDDQGNKQRKLPHHDKGGSVDLPHLRNALARAPQMSGVSDTQRARAVSHLQSHAKAEGVGDSGKAEDHMDIHEMSTAELARLISEAGDLFGERTKSLLDKLSAGDFALTETKRQDLQAFLETFSGIDAVRHDAEAVLAHKSDPKPSQSAFALAIELRRHRMRARGVEV
jgi:uncharacterized protein